MACEHQRGGITVALVLQGGTEDDNGETHPILYGRSIFHMYGDVPQLECPTRTNGDLVGVRLTSVPQGFTASIMRASHRRHRQLTVHCHTTAMT